jgi:hypothetical protein
MEWVGKLYGTTVGLDTAPLIYFVELHPKYLSLVDPFFDAVERCQIQVVTSALTLTEVLVHPFKRGNRNLANLYSRMLLNSSNLTTLSVSADIQMNSRIARGIRLQPESSRLLKPPENPPIAPLTSQSIKRTISSNQVCIAN